MKPCNIGKKRDSKVLTGRLSPKKLLKKSGMNKYLLQLSGLLLMTWLLLLTSGCGTARNMGSGAEISENRVSFLYEQVRKNQLDVRWLAARATISLENDGKTISLAASIKMRTDSVIWINVKKMGFELARALITHDSVYVIDRINNTYAVSPLSMIEEALQLPAEFAVLENLLLGNPLFLVTDNLQYAAGTDSYALYAEDEQASNRLWFDPQQHRLQRMLLLDKNAGRQLEMSLLNYSQLAASQHFSHLRRFQVNEQQLGSATMLIEFTKVSLDEPTSIHFEIPERYERSR
jgi:hypothetical protein